MHGYLIVFLRLIFFVLVSQGYMPANNEVRYIVDGMPVSMHKDVPTPGGRAPIEDSAYYRSRSNMKFEPSLLDFKERHLGVPHSEKVTLINMNSNKTIHMSSISGNTVHFHCSFFEDKVVPPLGNTTFNVVFLGREEGKIQSTLFIHTSEGSFKYQVTGTGVMSPYRLRPLVGVRMPLNSSFTPLIHMHNPHTFPLQIVEVYSSGGELCLELPSGEMEGPKNLWEILPFETKPVIRAKFVGLSEKNHTVYIRIIVNSTMDYLVVPLEVEVGPQAGLYSPDDLIDFGLSGSTDAPKVAKLYLLNSGRKSIQIQNVISTPVSKAVKIDFKPIKIPPDSITPTEVATITFDSHAAFEAKHFSGKIVAKGKQAGGGAQKVVVPYTVRVLPGGLSLNASAAHFCTDQPPGSSKLPQPRNFTMTNKFAIPVAVHNVSLTEDHHKYFVVKNFIPLILDPGETAILFQLGINEDLVTANFTLESSLYLHTNVSKLCIPLLCYNGRLKKVILPTEVGGSIEELGDEINFGLVGSGRKKDSYFAVVNENPVEIRLKSWGTNLSSTESGEVVPASVELAGVDSGNVSSLLARHSFLNMTKSLILKPHHYAVFKIAATAPSREGWLKGVAFVETQFERLALDVKMRSAKGSLDVLRETLVFDECFPGKLCEQPLEVVSSFEVPMVAKSVTTYPPDARVTFYPASVDDGHKCGVGDSKPLSLSSGPPLPTICPHGTSLLGHLTFNPKAACGDQCYLGISAAHKGGSVQWAQGSTIPVQASSPSNVTPPVALPSHVAESDSALVDILHSRFIALAGWQNVSLRLDTSEARRVAFKAAAKLVWPRLLWWKGSKCTGSRKLCPPANVHQDIRFPLTHVANTSFLEVTLENPSDAPILVQLALQYAYPQAKRVLDLLPRSLQPLPSEGEETTSPDEFWFAGLVPGSQWQWVGPGSGVGLPTSTPSSSSTNSASGGLLPLVLLQPKKSLTVKLAFKPRSPNLSTTLIFIRNNLTALEVVRVSGQGGYAQFRFGNRKPGNPSPLLFELTDKHLKDCERETPWKYSMPNLTVKRSFTARNTGDLPVFVTALDIDGLPCEGYGFRILSCGPFEMPANGTHKVEIAFTPDFTLSKVQRVLRIHSGGGAAGSTISNYTMLASLPTYMLAPCSSVLPRPTWESRLYLAVLSFCVILLLITIAAAFFESDRILKCTLVAMASSAAAAAAVSSPATSTCPPPVSPVNVACSSHQAWTHPPPQHQNHSDSGRRKEPSRPILGWVGMANRDRHEEDGVGVRGADGVETTLSSSTRGRKKLGRRNGGFKSTAPLGNMRLDIANSIRVDRVESNHARSSEDVCLLEVPKESSKRLSSKGCGKQLGLEGACSEEETCSTTTESSNNEEMEKSNFQENDISSRASKERSKSDSNVSTPSVSGSTKHSKAPSPALPNSRSSSNASSAPSPSSLSSSSASSSSSSSPPADFRENYESYCDDEDDYGGLRDDKTLGAALRAAERSCELAAASQSTSNAGSSQKSKSGSTQPPKASSFHKQPSSDAVEGAKSRLGPDVIRIASAPSIELPYKPKPLKNMGRERTKEGKGVVGSIVVNKRRSSDKSGSSLRGLAEMDHAVTRPAPPPPPRQQTPPPPPSSSPHQLPSWDGQRLHGNNQSNPTDSPSPPILYSNVVSSNGERQYPLLGPAVSRPSAISASRGQSDRPEEPTTSRKKGQSRGGRSDESTGSSSGSISSGSMPRGMLGPIGRAPSRPRAQVPSAPPAAQGVRLPSAWNSSSSHQRPLSSQAVSPPAQTLQSPAHDNHLFGDSFVKAPLQHESYTSQVNNVGYVGDSLSCSGGNKSPIGTVGGTGIFSGRSVWEQQSIMKLLQEERRKRVEEHHRINILRDNWPGFDSDSSVTSASSVAESLWDPLYSPPVIQSGLDKEGDQHMQKVDLASSSESGSESPWSSLVNHRVWSSSVWTPSEGPVSHSSSSSSDVPAQSHLSLHPPGLSPMVSQSVSSPPGLSLPSLPPVTPLTSSTGFESISRLISGGSHSPSQDTPLERAMEFDPFRSLGDIWSPRSRDSWSHSNSNNSKQE
ncbi:transmembrane protein 131 isoform X2 [Ischnura elegans]|uniref:transmembrane protein 131 isoform X2 n=1 Tax=Ischnura elegans TaxID=197161 RepID=UPI001ED87005|nr:transmembrane protein 131 isoform X2 [Ischnura elegans]